MKEQLELIDEVIQHLNHEGKNNYDNDLDLAVSFLKKAKHEITKVDDGVDDTRLDAHRIVSQRLAGFESVRFCTPDTIYKVWQHPRPKILQAVEENDFEDVSELIDYVEENIEEADEEDVRILVINDAIGREKPNRFEDVDESELGDLQLSADLFLALPYVRENGFVSDGFEVIGDNKLERLSALEHQQWVKLTKYYAEDDEIEVSDEKLEHWESLWKPYEELSEEQKEKDRKWARKVRKVMRGKELDYED